MESTTLLISLFAILVCAPVARSSRAEAELYRLLMANYSSLVRPVGDPTRALKVHMRVFLQQIINVDLQNQIVEINAWLKYIWTDYRLRWRAATHDNISSVRFPGGQIWQPDILLYNSADDHFDSTYKSNLVVYNTGEVNWIPPGVFKISCKMDITMFPFDEQVCFMKFGSWSYHGHSIDLRIDSDNIKAPAADLSTYIPNGEWRLLKAPARREHHYYKCCPEPYPTIKFFLYLRRRPLYYVFNILIPTFLISSMTLLAFSLPATDMSEKIGFQTTILLSVCFFLTILSEMVPTTSEAVPLLGMFFSAITLIVSVTTTFTIAILSIRYRQTANHSMSPTFRRIFMEFLPWLMMMRRPGYAFRSGRSVRCSNVPHGQNCVQCISRENGDIVSSCVSSSDRQNSSFDSPLRSMDNSPQEMLRLKRKVGEGLFVHKLLDSNKKSEAERYERNLKKFLANIKDDYTDSGRFALTVIEMYDAIQKRLKLIRGSIYRKRDVERTKGEWKFAAMALDRLCLCLFTFLLSISLGGLFFVTPHIDL